MLTMNQCFNLPALAGRHWLTLLTATLAIILSVPETAFSLSYFDRDLISKGEIWRLLSGHLTHTSLSHLIWDLIAFMLAMGYVERLSRSLAVLSLIFGVVAVNNLLLSPIATIDHYAGLSGVLFSPLIIALIHFGVKENSIEGWLPAVICAGKLISEYMTGSALLSESQWPAYTAAHLAGAAGGLMLICINTFRTERSLLLSDDGAHQA